MSKHSLYAEARSLPVPPDAAGSRRTSEATTRASALPGLSNPVSQPRLPARRIANYSGRGRPFNAARYYCLGNSGVRATVSGVPRARQRSRKGRAGRDSTEATGPRLLHIVAQRRSSRESAHVVHPLGIVVRTAGILHARAVLAIRARREELVRLWVHPAPVD